MKKSDFLVIFILDEQRYALPLSAADRVVRIVAINSLPQAPDIVHGVINIQGRVVPVFNMRRRFGLPEREIVLSDQLIVAHTKHRTVVLVADAVLEVIAYAGQSLVETENILPEIAYIEGVIKLNDGLIFIHDLDKFLSLEEESSLEHALEKLPLETT